MSLPSGRLVDEVLADQDFAKLVKASGSEYTKIATAGEYGDLRRNVLSTGETVYMASENSAAVNSDLKLPAVGSLGAAAGQASYLPSQPFRTAGASGQGYTRSLGRKVYELTDHLGNVHATVSDRRIYDATLKASLPEVKSLADYYPFGMQMPGKKLNPDGYRYGFNGKEHETGFGSDSYDFGARVYNSLTGTFGTIDPLASKFPSESNYIFAGNSPIMSIDYNGMFKIVVTVAAQEAGVNALTIANFERVVANISKMVDDNLAILNKMSEQTGKSVSDLKSWMIYGDGPTITVDVNIGGIGSGARGGTGDGILFEAGLVNTIGNTSKDSKTYEAILFATGMTVLHEATHEGDFQENGRITGADAGVADGNQNTPSKFGHRGTDTEYSILGMDIATTGGGGAGGVEGSNDNKYSPTDIGVVRDKIKKDSRLGNGFYNKMYNKTIQSFKNDKPQVSKVEFQKK